MIEGRNIGNLFPLQISAFITQRIYDNEYSNPKEVQQI